MEHRCATRVTTSFPTALVTANGSAAWGTLRNLSSSGAAVEISLSASCPTFVKLTLPLLDDNRIPKWIDACIVRAQHGLLGIEWVEELSSDTVRLLVGAARVRLGKAERLQQNRGSLPSPLQDLRIDLTFI